MDMQTLKIVTISNGSNELRFLKEAIEKIYPGSIVLLANNGFMGLQLALENDPDIIILDITIQDRDAYEICRMIKENERLHDIPVLILTDNGTSKHKRFKALEAGADSFLSKPPDELDLTVQIRTLAKIKTLNRFKKTRPEERSNLLSLNSSGTKDERLTKTRLLEGSSQPCSNEAKHRAVLLFDIVDHNSVRSLMDNFYRDYNIGIGVLDLSGKVLVANGWSDLCTKIYKIDQNMPISSYLSDTMLTRRGTPYFKRIQQHPISDQNDILLSAGLPPGSLKPYRCMNDIWDIVLPIAIGDERIGDLVLGQFFFDGEIQEYDPLIKPARRDRFDVQEFQGPLDRFPRWTLENVNALKTFYNNFTNTISSLNHSDIVPWRAVHERDDNLIDSEMLKDRYRSYMEKAPISVFITDENGKYIEANPMASVISGYKISELVGKNVLDFLPIESRDAGIQHFKRIQTDGYATGEIPIINKNGERRWWAITASKLSKTRFIGFAEDITKLKSSQETIMDYHNRLREIIDFLPDATLVIDKEGYVIAWNKAIEKMSGVKSEEMIGKGNYEYSLPFYNVRTPGLVDIVLHPNIDVENKYTDIVKLEDETIVGEAYISNISNQDGESVYLLSKASLLYDSQGKIIGAIESIRDITERRRLEEDLRIKDSAISASISAIAMTDLNGYITYINNSFLKLWGYDQENDVLGRHFAEFWTDKEYGNENLQKVLKEGSWSGEFSAIRKDGSHLDLKLSSNLVLNDHMEPISIIGFYNDVTEEKKAKDDLRNAEEKYRTIVEDMPNLLCRFKPDGTLTYVNDGYCKYFGQKRDDIIGSSFMPLIPEEDKEYVISKFTSLCIDNPVISYEHRVILPGNDTRWHRWTDRAIFDETDTLVEYQSIGEDITEIMRTQEALIQAKEAAEAAAKAKSMFLANMSHEIRTPLNAVIGMSELLLNSQLNLEQKDYVDTIKRSGTALLSIISDILDFSKIDAGKMCLDEQPFDLLHVVEEALDFVSIFAAEKGLELIYDIDDSCVKNIVSDPSRLRQILLNLLSNSIKFTECGDVVLTVESNVHMQGHKLHFQVKDTGIGIDQEQMSKLFVSFSQLDSSMTKRHSGTGLGLAICKNLVTMMGGRIWAESRVGEGSVFHFTIYIKEAAACDVDSIQIPVSFGLKGFKVLIVDDNCTNLKILSRQISNIGMIPTKASNASDALKLIDNGAIYDIAILDLCMPEIDGANLAVQIHERKGFESLPILILTSIGYTGSIEGVFEVLSKPVKQISLYQALFRVTGTDKDRKVKPQPSIDSKLALKHPLNILLAEDNLVNQKVLIKILNKLGYNPAIATSGINVLEKACHERFDLILMDLQMPDMDGVEATRHIRSSNVTFGYPRIIAMTAYTADEVKKMCFEAGMNGYLSKPVRIEDLANVLKESYERIGDSNRS